MIKKRVILFIAVVFSLISVASATSYFNITDDISFNLSNGAYITLIAGQNFTNTSEPVVRTYNSTDTPSSTLEINFNGTQVRWNTITNKSLSAISYNLTTDVFTFTGNGTSGYLNTTVSGLSPSTNYQVWNGTVNDYNLTTDLYGTLPDFMINFTTTQTTIMITVDDYSCGASLLNNVINIGNCSNLTEVNADIANASTLQDLGGGEWLLNANLINNNTANSFYLNETDVTWLKINSTNTSGTPTYWYYLTNGKTEINNTKITSWNTTSNTVENLPVSTWARSAVYASGVSSKMNISNSNLSYLGHNADNMYGVYYITSSYNQIINNSFLQNYRGISLSTSSNNNTLTSNIGTSNASIGIYLYSSSNNNLTSNTGTSNSNYGIYLYSASNNNLTSNIVTSNTSYGLFLYSSSNYNTLISNIVTSNTSYGLVLYSSSNNNLTSNTFNTNSTASTVEDIGILTSSRNNIFINTDFTTKPRKIEFITALTSEFNQSQDSGISFVSTNVSIARTTNRSIINWNQSNITFTETFIGTTQANYSATGLLSNTGYRVYNGTAIDYTLTTNAAGTLPDFMINFTTTQTTITITVDAAAIAEFTKVDILWWEN